MINWPAVTALVLSVLFGAVGSGLIGSSSTYWYFVVGETWVLAAVLYIGAVWLSTHLGGDIRKIMGFSQLAMETPDRTRPDSRCHHSRRHLYRRRLVAPRRSRDMIIDTECHVLFRVFPRESNPSRPMTTRASWHEYSGDLFAAEMERSGVDKGFLISYDATTSAGTWRNSRAPTKQTSTADGATPSSQQLSIRSVVFVVQR